MAYCRNCGNEVNRGDKICKICDRHPLKGVNFCQNCGAKTVDGQEYCTNCKLKLFYPKNTENTKAQTNPNPQNKNTNQGQNFTFPQIDKTCEGHEIYEDIKYLKPYYQMEFTKIYDSKEAYKGKWNWCAFLFSGIWLFVKGIPRLIIAYLFAYAGVTAFLSIFMLGMDSLSAATYSMTIIKPITGIMNLIFAIFIGLKGNYIYYKKQICDEDLYIKK